MSENITKKELIDAMEGVGLNLSPDILRKCMTIAINHNLSAVHFAELWEAHSLNKNVTDLNITTFSAYRNHVLKNIEKKSLSYDVPGAVSNPTILGKRSAFDNTNFANLIIPPGMKSTKNSSSSVSDIDIIAKDFLSGSQLDQNTASSTIITPSKISKHSLPKMRYIDRKNSGNTVMLYNPNNLPLLVNVNSFSYFMKRKCEIIQPDFFPHPRETYKHMYSSGSERAAALDQNLEQISSKIIESLRIPTDFTEEIHHHNNEHDSALKRIAPLESVGFPRQSLQTCIGRICNEAHEGKINMSSILLEGSCLGSNGARISLDVTPILSAVSYDEESSNRRDFSLFSGQIIAVEGVNTTGRNLVVRRLYEGLPPVTKKSNPCDLRSYHYDRQNGEAWKLIVAAGPFTPSTDLEYEPLLDLLKNIKEERADVVILMGPFVNVNHPMVLEEGKTILEVVDEKDEVSGHSKKNQVSHEMLFTSKVAQELEMFYEENNMDIQFILVPSLDDAVAEPVYPQPPLLDQPIRDKDLGVPGAQGVELGSLGLGHIENIGREKASNTDRPKRVYCVSNPCTFQINEVTIGVTSTDALLHMSTDETNGNLEPGSRLIRLSQHFLQQRSYYPLFPPPSLPSMEVNLDLRQMKYWSMPYQPDLLLLPSKLTTFAWNIMDGTIVINPGHLVRGAIGGTFAVIDVHPMKKDFLDSLCTKTEKVKNILQDRVRVEIKRI